MVRSDNNRRERCWASERLQEIAPSLKCQQPQDGRCDHARALGDRCSFLKSIT
ncbi:hypothetical protein BJY00DRAFT_277714 [Aspergillus carlsbadensis]|nr:hypothetical protein BJY00DRAFT_277714 [Aspergillus carlsbadensis]